jgi:hypothetical protein
VQICVITHVNHDVRVLAMNPVILHALVGVKRNVHLLVKVHAPIHALVDAKPDALRNVRMTVLTDALEHVVAIAHGIA